jgi:diaminopimelate epimerase
MNLCYQVSGGGNDFLALVEPERSPSAEEIAAWCRRGLALGADGLFVLHRQGAAAVRMDYWNADGQAADLCLNGTRCAARLAFDLRWAAGEVTVETGAGAVRARLLDGARVALELPRPARAPAPRLVALDGEEHRGYFVVVGVPHLVLPWPQGLEHAPVADLGRRLRRHPSFGPAGTNVDFVLFGDVRTLEIRSFERGVEAETLACGTGVLAAAAVGLELGLSRLPLSALTAGGFRFEVLPAAGTAHWGLAGDARLLARGEILPEAGALPPPPRWSAPGGSAPGGSAPGGSAPGGSAPRSDTIEPRS